MFQINKLPKSILSELDVFEVVAGVLNKSKLKSWGKFVEFLGVVISCLCERRSDVYSIFLVEFTTG